MSAPERHLGLWLSLLSYCAAGVEPDVFAARIAEATRSYQAMDYRQQGEFHRLLAATP
ncbi:MAG TPA: hypothetical protein VF655_10035 [Allosphingosinicella sp.]|jgi:hypothetical protein